MKTRLQDPPNLLQALDLLALGFSAHAIHERGDQRTDGTYKSGKRPIGKAWGLTRWDEERLRSAFKDYPGAGVGLALGPARGPGREWLGDLEGDGPEAGLSLSRLLGRELIDTRGWGSARGGHGLWIIDGDRLLKLLAEAGATKGVMEKVGVWHLDELPELEFRIGGFKKDGVTIKQVQSVCPPTVGDDGNPRRWNGVDTIAVLPESAYALLTAIAESHRMADEAEVIKAVARPVEAHKNNGHSNGDSFTITAESSLSAYGRKALEGEIDGFSQEGEGGRHAYLLRATLKLASLVKAGALTDGECLAGLKDGARKNGMGEGRFHEIDEAWHSGFAMASARVIPESPKRAAAGPGNTPRRSAQPDDKRPSVEVNTERHIVAGETLKAIVGDLDLFRRGDSLGTVVEEQADVIKLAGGVELERTEASPGSFLCPKRPLVAS